MNPILLPPVSAAVATCAPAAPSVSSEVLALLTEAHGRALDSVEGAEIRRSLASALALLGRPLPPADPDTDTDDLAEFLGRHNVTISPDPRRDDDALWDELALSLGDLPQVEMVVRRLRAGVRDGYPAQFSAKQFANAAEYAALCDFLRRMNELALAETACGPQARGTITVRMANHPRLHSFVEGGWLERYVAGVLRQRIASAGFFGRVLLNATLTTPGCRFETDVVALIDGQPLWIECKSGRFAQSIDVYRKRARALGIPSGRVVIAIAGVTREQANELSRLHQLVFIPVQELRAAVDRWIQPIAEESQSDAIATALKASQVAPFPELRPVLLTAIDHVAARHLPCSFGELRAQSELACPDVPRSAIASALTALVIGGALRGPEDRPLRNTDPTKLVVTVATGEALEAACLAAYRKIVGRRLHGVLTTAAGQAAFAAVVGAGRRSSEEI